MTFWHIQGRGKIPYGARRSVAMTCASALLVFAIYPGTVEATMIDDDARQAYRGPRDPFLIRPALSRVGLNAEACSLVSNQAGAGSSSNTGERASERAEYGAGMSNVAFLSEGHLFRDGDSRFGLEPRGLSFDARLPTNTLPDLGRMKARIENIGNCLNYMQYLLKTIGVIFSLPQGDFSTESDGNVVSNTYTFVFTAAGRSAANSSDSAKVDSQALAVSQAKVASIYVPKFKLRNTVSTIFNENQSKLTRNSSGRADVSISSSSQAVASSSKRKTPRRARSTKNILANFVIDVFSQPHIYVLMVGVFVFSLFLRGRV